MGNLQRQVGSHRVGQLARIFDLVEGNDHLGRNLLVELDILFEQVGHGARQRLHLLGRTFLFLEHLDGPVGQLEELQHRPHGADIVNVIGSGVVQGGILLGHQKDLLVFLHDAFQYLHRLIAADEKRHDHVGEHHDIAQRKNGIKNSFRGINHRQPRHHGPLLNQWGRVPVPHHPY